MTAHLDLRDIRISTKLRAFAEKCAALAEKEFGEPVGLTLMIHPYAEPGITDPASTNVREFQYISTLAREHMREALRSIVKKWDANQPDVPPHVRN